MLRATIIALLLFVPIGACAQSQQIFPQNNQPEPIKIQGERAANNTDNTSNQHQAPNQSIARQQQNPTTDNEKSTEKATNKENNMKPAPSIENYTFWLTILTGLLAAATAVLAIFTIKLWLTADDTAKKQLRAYISIEEYGVRNFDIGKPEFSFRYRNNGQTPAYDVRFFTWIAVLPYPLPKNFPHDDVREDSTVSRTTVGPGVYQRGYKPIDTALTPPEIAEIIDGSTRRLYFMGVARYSDVFKQPHETWFCVFIGGSTLANIIRQHTPPGVDVPAANLFLHCDQMNDAT